MKSFFRADNISAVITWFVVAALTIYLMIDVANSPTLHIIIATVLFVVYIIVWLLSTSKNKLLASLKGKIISVAVLISIVIGIYFVSPFSFASILMGIACGIFAYYFPKKTGLVFVSLCSLPLYFVYEFYWHQNSTMVSSLLFWTFNIFAFIMVSSVRKEQEAREEAEAANLRLVSTQSLLEQAVKQGERVRIARNIHDLLGHHLTALSIHLQVASRQSQGEVKETIEKCHQLSKLLLSDVREAVSDIRTKGSIDLASTIETIRNKLPQIEIDIDIEEEIKINDMEVADALIKCIQESITNTLKHAHGKHLKVKITKMNSGLEVVITNDGNLPDKIHLGNGLKGIQERIKALAGNVSFHLENDHFLTSIQIPKVQND
ncbi:sensor histidine kinase [Glaciecola sp. 1036]|uniref:sensor histidine kinase n=1 Tax=Alteromonadaceae TaxID=72275 RepID=UPI003D02B28D